MDGFGDDYTSSTSIEPNSPFQGNDVKKLSDEMDFKLKLSHKRRLARKHYMPTKRSLASVPKKKKMAERNKTQTLDVEEQHHLPRSYSFDSNDSRIAVDLHDDIKNNISSDSPGEPYDPIKNYLSPRPRYLKYNPDRRREIFARQNRVRRSASYDAGIRFPNEELESTLDCSLSDETAEETDIFASEDEHEIEHEHEDEKEEVFDDFEEGNRWNSKVFLQYLIVIIVLILTTITITSINSPNLSPAKEAIRGFMNLYNRTYTSVFKSAGFDFSEVGKVSKKEIDVDHDEIWTEDVAGDDDVDNSQLEGYKTEEIEDIQDCMYNEYHDEIWSKHDNGQFQDSHSIEIEEKEEISHELHEPVILTSQQIYSDFDRGKVNEESEVLMVEDGNGNGIGLDESVMIKLARFDPVFTALIGVCVLIILATLSILYYSKKPKISTSVKTTISHQNSINNSTKYRESCVNASPLTYKTTHSGSLNDSEAVSSSEAKSSYLEFSTDSPSYGSFTVEERIVKKKKSKQPEVMLFPVRRSSRIHKKSVTSP